MPNMAKSFIALSECYADNPLGIQHYCCRLDDTKTPRDDVN